MKTVAEILADGSRDLPPSESRLLLGKVLRQSAVWLLTHSEIEVGSEGRLAFNALVARRLAGEPIAYLLGVREFYGREFLVSPAVLIPRPETEMLVDLVKDALTASVGAGDTLTILDLGTGSGCIAISVALECVGVGVTAVDASIEALAVARSNARQLGASVDFIQSDWFKAIDGQRFNIIVSNPPYIAQGDAHLDQGDLRYEPAMALSCADDGLSAIRQIISEARDYLHPHGMLAVEHGYDQANSVRKLLEAAGFAGIAQHKDIAGITRISSGFCS